MVKNFLEWMGLKKRLHNRSGNYMYFKEMEIWWSAVGENIGTEVNGKGNMFSRPVLIYKKLSKESLLGIPLSTQLKQGSWYESFNFKGQTICANFAQVRIMSAGRLYNKIGKISQKDFAKVKSGFLRLYS